MKLKIAVFLVFGICFLNFQAVAQKEQGPDKIKAVKTVVGKFIEFEFGDYMHADIKKSNGKTASFWMGGAWGLEYFLALNRGKTMTLTYEVVDTYIRESGGRMTIERLKNAKIGTLTFDKWMKDLKRKYTLKQINNKYQPAVDKFTK